jgi:hypothetical protein
MGRHAEKDKPHTITGMTTAFSRKLLQYVFGKLFYNMKQSGLIFRVILFDSVKDEDGEIITLDRDILEDFLSFWGKQSFKVIIIPKDEEHEY